MNPPAGINSKLPARSAGNEFEQLNRVVEPTTLAIAKGVAYGGVLDQPPKSPQ
jgi:hypothetical protein